MKDLKLKIQEAKTENELKNVVSSMPKQDNGFRTSLSRQLEDAFWYFDLTTLEQKKNFMLKRL